MRKDSKTLPQLITMIIWLTCKMEHTPCPPLHLLVQVHPVAVAAIVTVIMTGQVVVAAASKTLCIVPVSDDSE